MSISTNTIEEVRGALLEASRCLIVSHYNPDPDAFGASCAMACALKRLGKDVAVVNQNGPSERYSFIPGMSMVHSDVPEGGWDTLCVLDCADLNRIGDTLLPRLPRPPRVVNIDHHISNDGFGTVRFVDPEASSTAELVFSILEGIPGALDSDSAVALLVGIYGDTGSFRYSCTHPSTFLAAHKLALMGASPFDVSKLLYGSVELSALKLQTSALLNVQLHMGGRVAEVIVTREMLESFGAAVEDGDMLAERARDIAGVVVAFAIREDGDIWRVSLRAKESVYNMSQLAALFGGGGHRSAAAFRSRKPLEEIRKKLLAALAEILDEERQ